MPLTHSVPRTRYPMALLAYVFAAIMVGTTLPTPMYALFADELQFHVLTTTVIFATYAGGVLFALLAFGRWSDVLGRRPVLLAGLGFAVVSAVVFVLADSVPELLIGRVLSGLSAGIFTGTATAAVIEAAPPAWRSRAAAVATVANIGGLGAGPLLAGVLVQYAPRPLDLSFVVHLVLTAVAAVAVLAVPETSPRTGRLGVQRLSIPPEARSVFVVAALAGCAILIVGMTILAGALHFSSLPGLIAAAVVAGAGQGISFSRGLAAVAEHTPPDRRAEVSSTYFVVAYVAIALPVVGEGFAAQAWGLQTSGVAFAVAVAVLAAVCLAAILRQTRRSAVERQLVGS